MKVFEALLCTDPFGESLKDAKSYSLSDTEPATLVLILLTPEVESSLREGEASGGC